MSTAASLAKIEGRIEDAARILNPVLIGTLDRDAARRAHDALNALAAALIEVGLLQADTTTTSKGA